MLGTVLEKVLEKKPTIYSITNTLSAQTCSDTLHACGGHPIFCNDIGEVREVISRADGININIGSLSNSIIEVMLLSGVGANNLNIPVVLDPDKISASALRKNAVKMLMHDISFSVIRGSVTELKEIASFYEGACNVSKLGDTACEDTKEATVEFAKRLATLTESIIVVTGKIDIIADSQTAIIITNEKSQRKSLFDNGSMLSTLVAAFVASYKQDKIKAVAAAVSMLEVCKYKATEIAGENCGISTYSNALMDSLSLITPEELNEKSKYEIL